MDSYIREYQFSKLCAGMLNFLTNQVSAMYYTAIKDRLYCDSETSTSRLSAQYVLYNILLSIMKCIGPIVPHLVEELYLHLPQKQTTSFFQVDYEVKDDWDNVEIEEIMEVLLSIKKEINKNVDGNTLQKRIEIELSEKFLNLLKVTGKISLIMLTKFILFFFLGSNRKYGKRIE